MFEDMGLAVGIYHWNDSKMYNKCKMFLHNLIRNDSCYKIPDYDIYAIATIIYPVKASTKNNIPKCKILQDILKADGIATFKKVFDQNNKTLVGKFFSSSLI